MIKWIGAALIIGIFSWFGYSMAAAHRREEQALRSLIGALDYMQCELQYRMTPLPELCRQAGEQERNAVGYVLLMLARELECKVSPDAEQSMCIVLENGGNLPVYTRKAFELLGSTLGRFDLDGQIMGLENVRAFCRSELDKLSENRNEKLRNYQTLGLCAGTALAIILM